MDNFTFRALSNMLNTQSQEIYIYRTRVMIYYIYIIFIINAITYFLIYS